MSDANPPSSGTSPSLSGSSPTTPPSVATGDKPSVQPITLPPTQPESSAESSTQVASKPTAPPLSPPKPSGAKSLNSVSPLGGGAAPLPKPTPPPQPTVTSSKPPASPSPTPNSAPAKQPSIAAPPKNDDGLQPPPSSVMNRVPKPSSAPTPLAGTVPPQTPRPTASAPLVPAAPGSAASVPAKSVGLSQSSQPLPPPPSQPMGGRLPAAPQGPTGLARPTSATPMPAAKAAGAVPPGPTGPTPPAAPAKAEIKQSPLRFLPFIVGGLLLFGIAFFIFSKLFGGQTPSAGQPSGQQASQQPSKQVALTYWGLWEPSPVLQEVISGYESTHPGVKIVYQQQSSKDYRERLQTAIASGRGPDIFRFHASWTPMMRQELSALPENIMSMTEFSNTFYPAAIQQLKLNNQIMGIPLMYEGLGLYYNEEILRTANVQPPKTWAEVKTLASQLTIRNGNKIQRAGMAIGNTSNVEHFADILALLMLQNGAKLENPTSQAAIDTLTFYTNFVTTDRVWDDTMPSSTVAFARGDVAMMLAPSWRAHDVKVLNPNLKFSIAPVPQLAGTKLTWASFWAEGVSSQSKSKTEAWNFLKYLSTADAMHKFHAAADKQRTFGEIYSRKDLASEVATDPYMGAFVSDAAAGQGWYLSSFTHDNGLNDQMIKYYENAVNTFSTSGATQKATLETLQQGVSQILRQYGLATGVSATTASPTSTTIR